MGRVHKVYSIDDARKIKKDEIMVAFGIDFDLMIGLQNCAAVITEEGGLLSHASVISRELGKPCLINVKNAMSTLQDGYLIELDTTKKKISILDKKVESKEQSKDVSLLSELSPEQIKGAKARNLRILFEANIPILPGIIANIRKDSNLEQIAREIVQKLLQAESLGTSCIVRSNSENEDTTENSMAGQYTSIVCQTEKKLLMKAIQDVISSYAKPKIATLTNATDEQNSVLIQPYYPQQYGGVAFSHNPLNKKEGVVLEASRFGAGAVVEGKGVTTTLPQNIKTEVEKTVHKIQEIFGRPMDVEWGYGEDGLKIFQARPIVFTTHHQDKTAMEEKKKLTIIAGGQGS